MAPNVQAMQRSIADRLLDSDSDSPIVVGGPGGVVVAAAVALEVGVVPNVVAPVVAAIAPPVADAVAAGAPPPPPPASGKGGGGAGGSSSGSGGIEGGGGGGGNRGGEGSGIITITDGEDEASESPLQFWLRVIDSMPAVVGEVAALGDCIVWRLGPLGQDIVAWAMSQVDDVLAQGYVRRFYIGITSRIAWRWSDASDGHRSKGYQRMFVLAISGDSKDIVQAEIMAIQRYRRYGRGGMLYSPDGHPLCQNRHPGGEGGMHHGVAPFCLYLVVHWNPLPRR